MLNIDLVLIFVTNMIFDLIYYTVCHIEQNNALLCKLSNLFMPNGISNSFPSSFPLPNILNKLYEKRGFNRTVFYYYRMNLEHKT